MESHPPFISVVIPTFNRAGAIADTIRSVLAQTYKDFELIVVDDGSTDSTAAVVAQFGDSVRLIRQANKGITGARNTGLRAARGTWIALQDSDDHWLPDKLAQHVQDLQAHPELKVLFVDAWLQRTHLGKNEVLSFEHSGFARHLQPGFTIIDRPLWHQIRYGVAWVQGTLIHHDLLKKIGLYDESLTIFTDYDLFCRLALHAPWGINRIALVKIQRLADDKSYVSSQRTKTPEKAYRTMSYIMEKLLGLDGLQSKEIAIVRERLAYSLSGWGNVLWQQGDARGARTCFAKAFRANRRTGDGLKFLATYIVRKKPENRARN